MIITWFYTVLLVSSGYWLQPTKHLLFHQGTAGSVTTDWPHSVWRVCLSCSCCTHHSNTQCVLIHCGNKIDH